MPCNGAVHKRSQSVAANRGSRSPSCNSTARRRHRRTGLGAAEVIRLLAPIGVSRPGNADMGRTQRRRPALAHFGEIRFSRLDPVDQFRVAGVGAQHHEIDRQPDRQVRSQRRVSPERCVLRSRFYPHKRPSDTDPTRPATLSS
jgi:hypothetical protein